MLFFFNLFINYNFCYKFLNLDIYHFGKNIKLDNLLKKNLKIK